MYFGQAILLKKGLAINSNCQFCVWHQTVIISGCRGRRIYTSKLCNNCKSVLEKYKKRDGMLCYSRLACRKCVLEQKRMKHFLDRDINAAKNILKIGKSLACFCRKFPPVAPGIIDWPDPLQHVGGVYGKCHKRQIDFFLCLIWFMLLVMQCLCAI